MRVFLTSTHVVSETQLSAKAVPHGLTVFSPVLAVTTVAFSAFSFPTSKNNGYYILVCAKISNSVSCPLSNFWVFQVRFFLFLFILKASKIVKTGYAKLSFYDSFHYVYAVITVPLTLVKLIISTTWNKTIEISHYDHVVFINTYATKTSFKIFSQLTPRHSTWIHCIVDDLTNQLKENKKGTRKSQLRYFTNTPGHPNLWGCRDFRVAQTNKYRWKRVDFACVWQESKFVVSKLRNWNQNDRNSSSLHYDRWREVLVARGFWVKPK